MLNTTSKILSAVLCIVCTLFIAGTASAQDTVFSHNFGPYFVDFEIFTLAGLNAEGDLTGEWTGDEFKDGDPSSHWSTLTGCDASLEGDCPSAGITSNPHDVDSSFLFIDRPEAPATHFMNLTETVELPGAVFNVTLGTRRTGGGFPAEPKSYDFFGVDENGNESFRIKVLADGSQERLGYIANGQLFNDLPTTVGEDSADDIANTGGPAFGTGDDIVELAVKLGTSGYIVEYNNLNESNAWTSAALPYNGTGENLAQIGLSYNGVVGDNPQQAGFFVGNLSVSGFDELVLGDFDGNDQVNMADFLSLSSNFGKNVDPGTDGDFDFSGAVNLDDWIGFKAAYIAANPPQAAAVPEPAGFGLMLLAGLGVLAIRRPR